MFNAEAITDALFYHHRTCKFSHHSLQLNVLITRNSSQRNGKIIRSAKNLSSHNEYHTSHFIQCIWKTLSWALQQVYRYWNVICDAKYDTCLQALRYFRLYMKSLNLLLILRTLPENSLVGSLKVYSFHNERSSTIVRSPTMVFSQFPRFR